MSSISITVSKDGNIRVQHDCSKEQHFLAIAVLKEGYFSSCLSDYPPEKFPGFPPDAVGYCAMGHTEIWTKEIVCPLCVALGSRTTK